MMLVVLKLQHVGLERGIGPKPLDPNVSKGLRDNGPFWIQSCEIGSGKYQRKCVKLFLSFFFF